jgi:DNA-binding GntR family transcriptional regulator
MAATAAERAYELLKEEIITTRMKPGAMIEEAVLVSDLGLGRTPVREALKRLEAERLVVVLPRRGMYVAEVTLAELRELEEVRLPLETLSARLAVQRITPEQLKDLERLLAEVAARADGSAQVSDRSLEMDRRLHELVWRASHNSLLRDECDKLFNLSMRLWYLLVDRLEPSDLHEEVFGEILAAAKSKDERRAEDAIRNHILLFGDSIRRHL